MKLNVIVAIWVACTAIAACGSGSSSGREHADGGGAGGVAGSGGTAGAPGGGGGAAGSGQGGVAGDADGGGAGGVAGAGGTAGAAGGDAGAACPADVYGNYTVTYASGCGTVLTGGTQQIVDTGACTGHFVSSKAGTVGAINGDASFDANGDFSGATLVIGSTSHTGCSGTWNASTRTMTVTCSKGDASGSQCVIGITRSG